MPLVLIEWVDSFGCSSEWQRLDLANPKPLLCRSVGWLLHDGGDCKVVVPHVSEALDDMAPRQGCGDMTIPTTAIRSIVDLPVPVSP